MSTDEQDALIGKAVRERAQLRTQLAALDAALNDVSRYFEKLAGEIKDRVRQQPNFPALYAPIEVPAGIAKYADLSGLTIALKERARTMHELQSANDLLKRMGTE